MQVQGSSLAIVHINQRTLKMCMACCGGANAVLGELVHGLAAQVNNFPLTFVWSVMSSCSRFKLLADCVQSTSITPDFCAGC